MMLEPGQARDVARRLQQRADELREQIRGKLGEAADSVLAADHQWSDAGAASAEAGLEYAEAQREILELRQILQALTRVEEGVYGTCVDCGVAIPAARLAAQPAALTCVSCQSQRERRGHVPAAA
ncbi:MAG: TraR/DksA C4-type zinc finger protein [Burkholderiales bacterium]|nr:TraR/DksA C4-type zinc finger protein [Burkholderiales bacterium]